MNTTYALRSTPRRPWRVVALTAAAGTAALVALSAAGNSQQPAHRPAAVTRLAVHHDTHTQAAAPAKAMPVALAKGSHHILRSVLVAHRLLRVHRIFRHRLFWRRHYRRWFR